MACSEDFFNVDASVSYYEEGTMDGCYANSGEIRADLPEYFRDGEKIDPSFAVYASASYEPVRRGVLDINIVQPR